MGKNSIPDGWINYSKIGRVIKGTNFIAFKVPLRKEICDNLDDSSDSFTLSDLFRNLNLTLIIDLTNTFRYYQYQDVLNNNIEYFKLKCEGHGKIPSDIDFYKFHNVVEKHLNEKSDALIGVHCTHGLNRTGYFICRFMIDYLSIPGDIAVKSFEEARGHVIDRENYRTFLLSHKSTLNLDSNKFQSSSSNQVGIQQKSDFNKYNNSSKCMSYTSWKSLEGSSSNQVGFQHQSDFNKYNNSSNCMSYTSWKGRNNEWLEVGDKKNKSQINRNNRYDVRNSSNQRFTNWFNTDYSHNENYSQDIKDYKPYRRRSRSNSGSRKDNN